jgi:hypothetical protein
MTMNAIEFPSVIDTSLLKAKRACAKKVELEYLLHWKPKSPSVHLHAGKAFAKGLEEARKAFYIEGHTPTLSVAEGVTALLKEYGDFECPDESPKSALRMAGALEYYFSIYPLGEDKALPIDLPSGRKAIEFSFLEPVDYKHPVTGDPILFSGRFDMAVNYAGGHFGEDDKTASQLGASWISQWDLDPQPTAYCWGAAKGGMPLDGFLIRGVSILKTKYGHEQAITYRAPWRLERWYEQVLADLADLERFWEAGKFPWNEGHACNEYGGCMFRTVCQSKEQGPWLETQFVRRKWDPVTRVETVL